MFRGTFTALVTPFRDGGVDVSALEDLIEKQIAAGVTGIVAIGTTGESPTLSHEEREQVIRIAVAKANKRCLVLAGTGSNATQHAIDDTKRAEKLGVRRITTSRARKDSSAISNQSPTSRRCRSCSTTSRDVAAWTSFRTLWLV